jgi:hypothetical protein
MAWSLLAAVFLAAGCGTQKEGPPPEAAPAQVDFENVPEEHYSPPMARVNGVTIYRATYDEILDILRQQIEAGDPDSVERYISATDGAYQKAIEEELLFQEAVKKGYDPKPEEIRSVYMARVGRAGSEAKLLELVGQRRLSKSEVLYDIRRTIALDRFVKQEIEPMISVSDDEVRGYYDSRPDLFTPDAWLKLGQIYVAAPMDMPEARREASLSKITGSLEKIRGGKSFESVAREDSEDPSGPANGGLMGLFKKGNLPEALDRAAYSLKVGQISDIVQSDNGYHLLKLYEIQGGRLEPFDKVKDLARERLFRKKRGDLLSGITSSLKESASIERLQA